MRLGYAEALPTIEVIEEVASVPGSIVLDDRRVSWACQVTLLLSGKRHLPSA